MNPNAPWILRQGEPISEPAPWMVETATLVLATVSRYYEAHMAASPVFAGDEVPPALAALLSGGGLDREVHLRQNQLGGTSTSPSCASLTITESLPSTWLTLIWPMSTAGRSATTGDYAIATQNISEIASATPSSLTMHSPLWREMRMVCGASVTTYQLPAIGRTPPGHRCARFCAHRHTVPAVLRVERLRSSSAGRHGIRGVVRRARSVGAAASFRGLLWQSSQPAGKSVRLPWHGVRLAPDQVSAEPPEASGIWLIGGAEGLQPHPDDGAIVAAQRSSLSSTIRLPGCFTMVRSRAGAWASMASHRLLKGYSPPSAPGSSTPAA